MREGTLSGLMGSVRQVEIRTFFQRATRPFFYAELSGAVCMDLLNV
jgi:hypothetical protein